MIIFSLDFHISNLTGLPMKSIRAQCIPTVYIFVFLDAAEEIHSWIDTTSETKSLEITSSKDKT